MTPEIEKLVRDKVNEHKAGRKPLKRGSIETCLLGTLGGWTSADNLLGKDQAMAMEAGFEGWSSNGASSKLHPDFYELGKKIAEENGL